jgi:TldD protein
MLMMMVILKVLGEDLHFDDEGMPTQKNLLIENGVLKGYLIDYRNSRKMKMDPTGSARRQSYKFSPTSRMNSTYIAPGKDKFEDIIKDTKYGLFAKKLGGGTVVPATGEFNFAVQEGYMIEDGKLTHVLYVAQCLLDMEKMYYLKLIKLLIT